MRRLHKRQPPHSIVTKTDIYVTRQQPLAVLQKRALHLLFTDNCAEITVHGLGAAILHAIQLALSLRTLTHQAVELSPSTSSQTLFDDYEPLLPDLPSHTVARVNSAIHIRIRRVREFTEAPAVCTIQEPAPPSQLLRKRMKGNKATFAVLSRKQKRHKQ